MHQVHLRVSRQQSRGSSDAGGRVNANVSSVGAEFCLGFNKPGRWSERLSHRDWSDAVDDLNSRLSSQEIAVNFDLDNDTGRIIVKVKDINSGKVIRQIPSESTLEFARNAEKGVGVLLDRQF